LEWEVLTVSTQPVDNVNMLISRRTLSPDISRDSGGWRTWDRQLALTLQERGVVLDELVRLLISVSTAGLVLFFAIFSGIGMFAHNVQGHRARWHRAFWRFVGWWVIVVGCCGSAVLEWSKIGFVLFKRGFRYVARAQCEPEALAALGLATLLPHNFGLSSLNVKYLVIVILYGSWTKRSWPKIQAKKMQIQILYKD